MNTKLSTICTAIAVSLKEQYPCSILTEAQLKANPFLNKQNIVTTARATEVTTETVQRRLLDHIRCKCQNSVELIRPPSGAYGTVQMHFKFRNKQSSDIIEFYDGWLAAVLDAAKDSALCLTPNIQTTRQLTWKPEIHEHVREQLALHYQGWLTTIPNILEL